jgi:hypothetical protein
VPATFEGRANVRKSSAPLSSCVGTGYSFEVDSDCFNACSDVTEREFFTYRSGIET